MDMQVSRLILRYVPMLISVLGRRAPRDRRWTAVRRF